MTTQPPAEKARINPNDIRTLRAHTNWTVNDCRKLLQDCDSVDIAISKYDQMKANITMKLSTQKEAYLRIRRTDWWLKDFFLKKTKDLLESSNEKLKRWGQERQKAEEYSEVANSSSLILSSLEKATEIFEPGFVKDHEPIELSESFWHLATRAGRIPRFEPDWLSEIKNSSMCKLQMLKSTDISKQIIIETANFEAEKLDVSELLSRSKYMSESITQAEQYLIASDSVQLRARPLLLYYAATSLVRAMLVPKILDLVGRYGSHGLAQNADSSITTMPMNSLHRFRVTPAGSGLFTALVAAYDGRAMMPDAGPWSYMDLMAMIPELTDTINQYTGIKGKCAKIVNFHEHTERLRASNSYPHFAVSSSFLKSAGFQTTQVSSASDLLERIKTIFPGYIDYYRPRESFHDPYWQEAHSSILNEPITMLCYHNRSRKNYRNLYPILFDGGIDGNWYLINNSSCRPPHQLNVLLALLYGMSMLVRYKPVDWSDMLSSNDGCREIIEETINICRIKLPALVTEEILHRRILGSLEKIPF